MVEDPHGADPNVLIFGERPEDDSVEFSAEADAQAARRKKRARRRRRRSAAVLTLLLAVLLAAGAVGWVKIRDQFQVKNYAGSGTGSVIVRVKDGDNATNIAQTLVDNDVVASVKAFTNAANANDQSRTIQPGAYRLRQHMSAAAALNLLLDPASKVTQTVTLPEGIILPNVEQRLAAALGVPESEVKQAAARVSTLGIPTSFRTASGPPKSAEGFLWPDTYSFDPGTTASHALQSIVGTFASKDHSMGFSTAAQANGIAPYNALIVASIVESEAKFDADRAKVARVIYNRLAAHRRLQVDATSAYAAKLQGLDPTKVEYATINSPYNTYTHDGLPPTPIDNPGASSLKAAAPPAKGTWLFYVNIDAAGHLGFFDNEADFEAAVQKCQANHWGCG